MNQPATRGNSVLAVLGIAAATLVLVFAFVPKTPTPSDAWNATASTYSPGPEGVEALYLLLAREGLTAERWRRPGYSSLRSDETLWVVSDATLGTLERRQLLSFVDRGGTLVARPKAAAALVAQAGLDAPEVAAVTSTFVSDDGSEIEPGEHTEVLRGGRPPTETFVESREGEPLVAAWSIGRGRLVAFGAADITRNEGIGHAENGILLVHLARQLGKAHTFDEVKTGFAKGGIAALLLSLPYRGVIAQLALALAVALVAAMVRRQPVEPVRAKARRSTRDHVEAVGYLWARSGDTRLPLSALARAADDRGATHVTAAAEPFLEWVASTKPHLAARATAVRHAIDAMCRQATPPSAARARSAAIELRIVEREMRRW